MASGASYFVYRAVINIPVREVEVKSYYVAVAAKALPVGTMVAPERRQAGGVAGEQPGRRRLPKVEEVVNRGLIAPVVENEPLTSTKLALARIRRGSAPDDRDRHARDFGEGQRGHRRRRLRGAWHARRRGRHNRQSKTTAFRASSSATRRC